MSMLQVLGFKRAGELRICACPGIKLDLQAGHVTGSAWVKLETCQGARQGMRAASRVMSTAHTQNTTGREAKLAQK